MKHKPQKPSWFSAFARVIGVLFLLGLLFQGVVNYVETDQPVPETQRSDMLQAMIDEPQLAHMVIVDANWRCDWPERVYWAPLNNAVFVDCGRYRYLVRDIGGRFFVEVQS